jgi:hypothetical protein
MKAKTAVPVVFILVSLFMLTSCKKDQSSDANLSDVVKRYLEFRTKMSAMNASEGQMSNFLSIIGASQLRNNKLSLKTATGDSVYTDSVVVDTTNYWDYYTCATVTETDNGDGTNTTVYDYGDGCDEFGALTKGKITYIWKNTGDDYYSKVLYEHYSCYGMEMNGTSEYTFTSDGNSYFEYDTVTSSKDSSGSSPGVLFYWSGTSTCKEEMSIVYDNGDKFMYAANYSNKWDNSTYTVLEGEYTCTSDPNVYEYHYLVTFPLFYNYECADTWIPVSGIETIQFRDTAEMYDFKIDYGNGNCDNLATVTENGESSVVDFGDLIVIYCEDVSGDSITVNYRSKLR